MTFARRKLTLQLTPLLDLMLIVIFAQYMEVRERSTQAHQLARESQQSLEDTQASLAGVREDLQRERTAWQAERERLTAQHGEAEELQRTAERLREQRDRIGELAAEMFRVPPDLVEKALRPGGAAASTLSEREIEQLKQQFRELGEMRGNEMVEHLLTYSELRKRADIWDVYIAENGVMTLDTGERRLRWRADTSEQFAARLFDHYKTLSQPKGLVVVLLSWGNARAVWREAALQGLPIAAMRMRDDSGGRTRFEYAVLGYRPQTTGDS